MSDGGNIAVLGICGSLRRGSYNMAALRAAIALKPAGMTDRASPTSSQIPLYNEDVRQQGFPPPVETLRRQIAAADALLFACPEYNYSMSGVLKNAIDWASRPPDQPFAGKPVRDHRRRRRDGRHARARNTICAAAASFSTCTRSTSRRC